MAAAKRAQWTPPSAARVRRIRLRLRELYGTPALEPHGDALGELILTVLSQSTNDRNRDVAYLRLRDRLPTWEAVRDAPLALVEEAIRPGGISKVKSARIQAILRAVAPTGPLSLDFLRELDVGEARDYLCALPGVGRKTAACVLLFSFGAADVPVDTHVARVGQRLRLLRPGAPFEELHDEMLALTPPGAELELHVNLLRHGRRICHARRPECEACALARMCPSRQAFGTTMNAITA
jgi:endonuclease-3